MKLSLEDVTTRYSLFLGMVLIPWLVIGLLRTFGPVGLKPLDTEIVSYLSSFLIVLFSSYSISFILSAKRGNSDCYAAFPSRDGTYKKLYSPTFFLCRKILLLAAMLFPLIACYDFFIVKGAVLSEIVSLREKEHFTGPRGSLVGALGTLFSAAPPLAFVVYLMKPSRRLLSRLFIWGVIAIGFGSLFLSGGRNAFFISVGFVFVFSAFFISSSELNRAVSPMLRKLLMMLILLGFFYSMKIFVDRFKVYGMDAEIMIYFLKTQYNVDVSEVENASELYLSVYSAWVYLVYYMTHALSFFEQYFVYDVSPYLMGTYNFSIVARVVDLVTGSNYVATGVDSLIVKGVYLTLPGSLYVDFGFVGGLLAAGFLGVIYGRLVGNFGYLKFYQKMWLVYICTIMLFSPFYSVVGIANGFSFLFLLTIIVVFSFRLKRRAL